MMLSELLDVGGPASFSASLLGGFLVSLLTRNVPASLSTVHKLKCSDLLTSDESHTLSSAN
uniref:Uncharacterized protein n=1 Tax=Arundo donax TaxID=35708 RepID=A0A0A9DIT0_ARUDO